MDGPHLIIDALGAQPLVEPAREEDVGQLALFVYFVLFWFVCLFVFILQSSHCFKKKERGRWDVVVAAT
jgi:hypothetical protein